MSWWCNFRLCLCRPVSSSSLLALVPHLQHSVALAMDYLVYATSIVPFPSFLSGWPLPSKCHYCFIRTATTKHHTWCVCDLLKLLHTEKKDIGNFEAISLYLLHRPSFFTPLKTIHSMWERKKKYLRGLLFHWKDQQMCTLRISISIRCMEWYPQFTDRCIYSKGKQICR